MAKLFNLARMTTATTGTGTLTLGSAASGHLSFAAAGVSDGDIIRYAIIDGTASEVGLGTYTSSGTTLTRTVLKSTNSDAAISLSGSAEVFIADLAEDHLPHDSLSIPGAGPLMKSNSDRPIWSRSGVHTRLEHVARPQSANGAGSSGSGVLLLTADGFGYALSTGTTTTGEASHPITAAGALLSAFAYFEPGTIYEATLRILDAVSDGTDTYGVRFGPGSPRTFVALAAEAIYFSVGSGLHGDNNIRAITRSSSTSTTTDTGVALVSNTPVRMRIWIESTSSVRFYLDDVLVATNTTNISTSTGDQPVVGTIKKSAGTNARRCVFSRCLVDKYF